MALKLVDLNLLDVAYVCRNLRADDARELFALRFDDNPDGIAVHALQGWSLGWVAWGDERPIAVIGAKELWPGVWSAGMFATDEFGQIGPLLTRWVRRRMIPALRELGMHRAEAKSIEGHDVAHRWLERLGARVEGEPMRNYGKNRETFVTYVWEF
ncbi:MAG TPA: hypothetical protein VGE88_07015 [Lysobacter sp.]